MTINSTTRKAGPFIGNGSAASFPFTFKVFQASDLDVVKLNTSTNAEQTLVLTADYTVTLNQDQDSNPGGTVTLTAGALPSGFTLTMTSDVANLQPTDLTNQGGFYPEVINDSLDRATIQIQQLQEQVDRSIKLPLSSTASSELPFPDPSKLLGWNSNGSALTNFDPASVVSVVGQQNSYADIFTGNGVTTNFTLTRDPGSVFNIDVSIQGVTQAPNVDYILNGTVLSFTTAPPAVNSRILARYSEVYGFSTGDAVNVRYVPAGPGAVTTNVQAKLRETVSILDFGADSTGVNLCNSALDAAKAVCNTVYFPPGTYRIENYNLEDLRLIGAGGLGPNYGVNTTIIEGSGDIFVDANNFALSNLTIRNTASGVAGKLISVKDIDTGIGPIINCQFLRAAYHIYSQSATHTIVGATIQQCLFREATVYSRYYENQGLFQYSEIDCYTQANKRGLFIKSTSTALISASVFEFQDEGAVYVVNTTIFSDVIRGLKFQNIHFEQNGNVTPSPDVTLNITLSLAKVEFDSCGFYASTVAGNVDCTGSLDLRIFEHNCQDASYTTSAGTKLTIVNRNAPFNNNGLYIQNQDLRTTKSTIFGDKGFRADGGVTVSITGSVTPTPVPISSSSSFGSLILVRDATTAGVALLIATESVVTTVSSTLTSISFGISGGFLTAQTTGGAANRNLFFNYITT